MSHWKQIGSENARARSKIYSLMAPFKWQYLCGMVLRMFSQVSWGFWYGSIVALPGEIMENSTNPLEEVRVDDDDDGYIIVSLREHHCHTSCRSN